MPLLHSKPACHDKMPENLVSATRRLFITLHLPGRDAAAPMKAVTMKMMLFNDALACDDVAAGRRRSHIEEVRRHACARPLAAPSLSDR